jgi:hypothetical protein
LNKLFLCHSFSSSCGVGIFGLKIRRASAFGGSTPLQAPTLKSISRGGLRVLAVPRFIRPKMSIWANLPILISAPRSSRRAPAKKRPGTAARNLRKSWPIRRGTGDLCNGAVFVYRDFPNGAQPKQTVLIKNVGHDYVAPARKMRFGILSGMESP